MKDEEEKSMEQKRRKGALSCRRITAVFFLLMLVCTFVSRIYDSITVPKVATARAKEKTVETVVAGTGTVREQQVFFCPVFTGLRVESVTAMPGKQVDEGDELFCFSRDSMEEKRNELKEDISRLQLALEKETISSREIESVTEQELAVWELNLAKRELSEGQQEYEEKMEEYEAEKEKLLYEYERKRAMTREELWEQQEREEEAARQTLDSAKNSRNSALREARRKAEDLEEELAEMESEDKEDKEITRKKRELARAKEDLDDLEDEWDDRINDAEYSLDLLDDQSDRIRQGDTSTQTALQESYEEAIRQQEQKQKEEAKKLKELEKAVEQAQWEWQIAIRKDENIRLSHEQNRQLSQLARQEILLDISQKEQELMKLEKLFVTDGKVYADRSSTIVENELLAGKTSSGEERLAMATGSFCLEGKFEKEGQKLTVGDVLQVTIPGTIKKQEVKIEEMNLLGDTMGVFRAGLEQEIPLGAVTEYECRKQSAIYRQVIPLQGLRKDMKGYYCLVASPRRAILGEEFAARRVDLQLLYLGSVEAAVEGPLQATDEIIIRSNQIIEEGNRVRLTDDF